MKRFLLIILITFAAASAQAADVGVSISVGQPGFYGHIELGDFGRPELVYAEPVIIGPPHRYYTAEPLYLRVPPHHRKNWKKNCHRYNAYGRPVYFVTDRWYDQVYVPQYQSRYKKHRRDYGAYEDDRHDDRRQYDRRYDRDRYDRNDRYDRQDGYERRGR
jgi:hypothetical protein